MYDSEVTWHFSSVCSPPPLYKVVVNEDLTLIPHLTLITSLKTLFPNKVTSQIPGVRSLPCLLQEGEAFNPLVEPIASQVAS